MDLKLTLTQATQACRQHYLQLLLIAAFAYPLMLVEGYVIVESDNPWLAWALVTALAIVHGIPLAATVHAAALSILGAKPSFGECYDAATDRLGAVLISEACYFVPAMVLWWSIIGIPLMFFMAYRWMFSLQAVMLEDLPPVQALGRSSLLVRRSPRAPMALALTLNLLPVIPALGAPFTGNLLFVALADVLVVVAQPFTASLMTSVFIQLRNAEPLPAPAS
jgi:phosphatidylglycerophosphate synthase